MWPLLKYLGAQLQGEGAFRARVRRWIRLLLKRVFPRGVRLRFGGRYDLRLDQQFLSYRDFGDKHNRGWQVCLDRCRTSRVFFDIGAHVGFYSVPAGIEMRANGGQVHAFEPGTVNLRYLARHLALNRVDNVTLHDCLVGDSECELEFYEDLSEASAMNSLTPPKQSERYRVSLRRQVTLDGFCEREQIVPDLLKIDAEGAEYAILQGGRQVLATHHPPILLSVHPRHLEQLGLSTESLAALIEALGYCIFEMDGQTLATELCSNEYLLLKNSRTT